MGDTLTTWQRGTANYGHIYYLSRVALITASAIVAAGENLNHSHVSWLVDWVPALSLLVAILTALDTWLKPQQKWKGFMESRDALEGLIANHAQGINGMDDAEASAQFAQLRKQHREHNIF